MSGLLTPPEERGAWACSAPAPPGQPCSCPAAPSASSPSASSPRGEAGSPAPARGAPGVPVARAGLAEAGPAWGLGEGQEEREGAGLPVPLVP